MENVPKKNSSILKNNKMLTALAGIALKEGNKNIAYHQDADGKYESVYNSLTNEFKRLKNSGFNCLAIVPKEMIEAWLLADIKAYPQKPQKPALPFKPEELWGNKDSKKHPKVCIAEVLKQFNLDPCSDVFFQIAEKSSVETLLKHCSVSFGKFYTDLQTFIRG